MLVVFGSTMRPTLALAFSVACTLPSASMAQSGRSSTLWISRDTIYERIATAGAGSRDTVRYVWRDSIVYVVSPQGLRPLSPRGSRTLLRMAHLFSDTDSVLRHVPVGRRPNAR